METTDRSQGDDFSLCGEACVFDPSPRLTQKRDIASEPDAFLTWLAHD